MEYKQKHFIALTVFLAVVGVGLLVTALATDYWVVANPSRQPQPNENVTSPDTNTGNSSFGLFNGQQSLKYSTGERFFPLETVCNASESVCAYIFKRTDDSRGKLLELIMRYQFNGTLSGERALNYGLFSYPLWLTTLLALALAIILGLLTIGFAIFNVFGRPIETITGPLGLYLWNLLSLLFTVLTLALFGSLFSTQLSENFLNFDDYSIGWRNTSHTYLGWSYFLLVGAAATFLANLVLLFLSGHSLACSYAGAGEKEVDNGMILY